MRRRLVVLLGGFLLLSGSGSLAGEIVASSSDAIDTGDDHGERLGFSVAIVGDVDGDGRDDVAVGVPNADLGSGQKGAVYVFKYNTGTGYMEQIGSAISGDSVGDRFGLAISRLGHHGDNDLNGDDRAEFIIGAPPKQSENLDGHAYIYSYVNVSGTNVWWRMFKFTGEQGYDDAYQSDQFGYYIAGPGNVDGAGLVDVAVSAVFYKNGSYENAGRAYVFFLDEAPFYPTTYNYGASDAPMKITGAAANDNLGRSIGGAGNLDSTAGHDIVVGCPGADLGETNRGYVEIYGWDGSAVDLLWRVEGTVDNADFGWAAICNGDLDGDTRADDLVIGAPGESTSRGRVYWFDLESTPTGSTITTSSAIKKVKGEANQDQLGRYVLDVGDVDGNGDDDLLISAPTNNDGGGNAGRSYLFYGVPSTDDAAADTVADVVFTGEKQKGNFGSVGYGWGNIDGDEDELHDIVIGADSWDPDPSSLSDCDMGYTFDPPCTCLGSPNYFLTDGPCDDRGRAYFFLSECGATWDFACPSPLPANPDIDGNGVVNEEDLNALMRWFNDQARSGKGDFNNDGSVDGLDLMEIIGKVNAAETGAKP